MKSPIEKCFCKKVMILWYLKLINLLIKKILGVDKKSCHHVLKIFCVFDIAKFGGLLNQKLRGHIGKNLWAYTPVGVL